MSKAVILLVEDNVDILKINRAALQMRGYRVLSAASVAEARALMEADQPDLAVLDIMLPDGSGLDFCQELRQDTTALPVLFLTALAEKEDLLAGLRQGGDDYLVKPYDLDILIARIEALLRRTEMERDRQPQDLVRGPLRLNLQWQKAYQDGQDLQLTPREFALLLYFLRNVGKGFDAQALYAAVWGGDPNGDVRTVKVHVYSLRKKLGLKPGGPFSIELEDRRRYVWVEREDGDVAKG